MAFFGIIDSTLFISLSFTIPKTMRRVSCFCRDSCSTMYFIPPMLCPASQMMVGFVPNFCQRPMSPVEVVTFENPFLTCSAVMLYPLSLRTFNSDSIVLVFFI